jgi:carboxymethylenebutenolidase
MRHVKADFDSLVAETSLSNGVDRRGFMKTAFGRIQVMHSTPITGRAMSKPMQRMAGAAAWNGSSPMG